MTVYRYKFSNEFMVELTNFATIHRHDPHFKESWEAWVKKNNVLVDIEFRRLVLLGYVGNMAVKMYKSVRYYYKNKPAVPVPPKKRKKYNRLSADILQRIDRDIALRIGKKPSVAFTEFLKIQESSNEKMFDGIPEKTLKKTYKNRFYKASLKE